MKRKFWEVSILFRKIFLVLFINFFFIEYVYSQLGGPCTTLNCYGESCNCTQWSPWEDRWENVPLDPDFPLCTLRVRYCYRQCLSDPYCVEYQIKWWAVQEPYCGQCDELIAWLQEGDEWLRVRHMRGLFIDLWRKIVHIEWTKFIDYLVEHQLPLPYCDERVRYKYYMYTATCVAMCYTQHPISDPTIEILVTPINCIAPYCCKREIALCIERETGETSSIETVTSTGYEDCLGTEPPLSNCPPGENVYILPCVDSCTQD